MKVFFNVPMEFDSRKVDETIRSAIKNGQKGYVCAIEANNLAVANKNPVFHTVVNNALVNICDGSNLAWLLGKIHREPFKSYTGSDLFIKWVSMSKYKQYFLGNTKNVLDRLKENLSQKDSEINGMRFVALPFRKVSEFDYKNIAEGINSEAPDIIWVSLGAPKQEEFMSLLLPYLHQGVMIGVGAVFNFYAGISGQMQRAPKWLQKIRMEWLYRAIEEPRKNIPRYLSCLQILPRLIIREYKSERKT
jgi:N-acetylglucosaminyldiphosphoundecaprenol N-acetyl-beta-D-mannosaminyltransferase